ncbi:MAG: DUF2752 domain-containing protein [Planctomycetales bacterium]|nr:DUF2752 domain-containing protein [Planctomycetales bacterium]
MACVLILGAATALSPDPRGFGTHEQWGLAPCWVQQRFNLPCPSCGMTTAFSHVVRGQLVAAFASNAGGTALALTTVVIGCYATASWIAKRWVVTPPSWSVVLGLGTFIVTVTLLDWVRRVAGP